MSLEELNYKIYNNYLYTIDRYMELEKYNQKEKVDVATLNIKYAIDDINRQIKQYNPKNPELSVYYQLMIKTDFLIETVLILNYTFKFCKKHKYYWKDDYTTFRKFKLLRNLTLAHPLKTTHFEEYGFDDNNNKWCEDVRPKGPLDMHESSKADYIIVIREKGKNHTTPMPITINNDILPAAFAALKHLEIFTEEISSRLSVIIEELKNEQIEARDDMEIQDYIKALKNDLKRDIQVKLEK